MSTLGNILFAVCAIVAIGGAVGTVVARSPLRSAVSLLFNILALAGLYLTLHAHLLAAIQLIVYAGAVVVLFVFVIMLIGPSDAAPDNLRGLLVRTFGGTLLFLLFAGVAFAVSGIDYARPLIKGCSELESDCGQFGGVEGLGRVLFTEAAIPFEIASVLLLVAIVGAVAVAGTRRRYGSSKTAAPVETSALQPSDSTSAT